MYAVTAAEMGALERRAIEGLGIPALLLMENAAAAFVRALTEQWGAPAGKRALVFCGKGNNGGDGCAIARQLVCTGADARIVLLDDGAGMKPDARVNLDICRAMDIPVYRMDDNVSRPLVAAHLAAADFVVDALFGTGFHGTLQGVAAEAVELIDAGGKPVAAVDMPSGADSDMGHVDGACVQADLTVTFALPKVGQLIYPGRAKCGTVVTVPISIPPALAEGCGFCTYVLDDACVRATLPLRAAEGHKGSFGRVFALAGSQGMTGAAAMCAVGALKAGCGMVTLGTPGCVADVLSAKLTEVMTLALPSLNGGLSRSAYAPAAERLAQNDVLLMGCGAGQSDGAADVMRRVLADSEKPAVVDADGLNALCGHAELLGARRADTVLTPHPAEFARLAGIDVAAVQRQRVSVARTFAQAHGVTLVLKGADTVAAHPDGSLYINTRGNNGMATAGSGDVLAGIIAGFIAQGLPAKEAANTGVYVHALAGDAARGKYGEYSLTATNILECIGSAIGELLG